MNGNKGEWSELYTLIKLLSIGKLYAADENTTRLKDIYFPIIKIFRSLENPFDIEYLIHSDQGIVEITFNKAFEKEISQEKLSRIASYLYSAILNGNNRSFPIDHADEIMNELLCKRIAAPSSDKTDINLQLHDIHTGYDPIFGFSIKSELGASPTLLNASAATNFIFRIEGISDNLAENINAIESKNKILDRIDSILKNGSLEYQQPFNANFYGNLLLIDANMDKILADILLDSYSNNINNCQELIRRIDERNPLHYPRTGIYEFKFKKLLAAVALGMVPSKEWDGKDESNGGYVIVKKDGDIVAYHIYNRNSFEEYLLKNTKLERGSTSRHGFASIYHDQHNNMNINLNLQIRFI